MEDLTSQKVHKWLFWGMLGVFMLLTYLNFYSSIQRLVSFVFNLPFWFVLTSGVLSTFFLINLLGMGQSRLDGLEERLFRERQGMIELERRFRLAKQDPAKLGPSSFKRYAADVLRLLGFEVSQSRQSLKGIDWQVIAEDGSLAFVACSAFGQDFRGDVHQLYYQMLKSGVAKGWVITSEKVEPGMERWAKSLGINCINSKEASRFPYPFQETVFQSSSKIRQN